MHILFIFLSMQNIISKLASEQEFLSWKFIVLYGGVLACLFIYAIFWQQTIKHIPLATAYANKAVTVVWGLIWGYLFFHEGVTVRKLIGAAIIIVGVLIVVSSDEEDKEVQA